MVLIMLVIKKGETMRIENLKGKLYSVEDIAETLNVTPHIIRGLIKDGKIKGYKVGRLWRVDIDSCMDYLNAQTIDDIKNK